MEHALQLQEMTLAGAWPPEAGGPPDDAGQTVAELQHDSAVAAGHLYGDSLSSVAGLGRLGLEHPASVC